MELTNKITGSGEFTFDGSFNQATIWVSGSFAGGTFTTQLSGKSDERVSGFLDVPNGTITTSTMFNIYGGMPRGRVTFVTGSGNPDLDVYINKIF